MITERSWLLPCTNQKQFYKTYTNYTVIYQELINNTFECWVNQMNTNYEKTLEKNILVGNQNNQYWHLTSNLES